MGFRFQGGFPGSAFVEVVGEQLLLEGLVMVLQSTYSLHCSSLFGVTF